MLQRLDFVWGTWHFYLYSQDMYCSSLEVTLNSPNSTKKKKKINVKDLSTVMYWYAVG